VIACEYYNNVAFTKTELGPKLLEIVLIVSNGLVLSLVFVFTAVTAVERKVKAAAIAAVCRTVAEEITSLQQQRMAQAQSDILNHPSVQHLIKEYDAKIVPGTLRLLDH
jgi:hypothetical protein